MTTRSRCLISASIALLLAASACTPDDTTSQGAAELFVDRHYVHINPTAAQEFSTGLALEKLKHIAQLTAGLPITAETKAPTVRYRIVESQEETERGTYVFEGTIYVEDDEALSRRWIISTRRVGSTWRVSNFTEEYE